MNQSPLAMEWPSTSVCVRLGLVPRSETRSFSSKPPSPLAEFDAHGMESVPYDLEQYLRRLGPDAALTSFAAFAAATAAENPFAPSGHLDGSAPDFARARRAALGDPQIRDALAPLHGPGTIPATTVGEINIAGLPGVTVPAGYYESKAPFCLIVLGRQWCEAELLAYAYAYEQETRYRMAPVLVGE